MGYNKEEKEATLVGSGDLGVEVRSGGDLAIAPSRFLMRTAQLMID